MGRPAKFAYALPGSLLLQRSARAGVPRGMIVPSPSSISPAATSDQAKQLPGPVAQAVAFVLLASPRDDVLDLRLGRRPLERLRLRVRGARERPQMLPADAPRFDLVGELDQRVVVVGADNDAAGAAAKLHPVAEAHADGQLNRAPVPHFDLAHQE